MSDFTPERWTVEQCSKHDRYNYHIRNDVKGGFALVEDWAEATLIAAAPELLEAAAGFLTAWDYDDFSMGMKEMSNLRAAIARARGES